MSGYFCICVCTALIKEAVLSGVALEDDKREKFNKIKQVFPSCRIGMLMFLLATGRGNMFLTISLLKP